jgi:cytochrome c oxidase assembly factor CtaG
VQPFPSEPRWPRWSIPLYLFLGMFPSGALGAFLAFCDRVLYRSYREAPHLFSLSPLTDQILAGSLMWVLGIFVCLIPAVAITFELLSRAPLAKRATLAGSSSFSRKEFSSAGTTSPL